MGELEQLREFAAHHAHLIHHPRRCELCKMASRLWHEARPDVEEYMEPEKLSPAFAPSTEDTT